MHGGFRSAADAPHTCFHGKPLQSRSGWESNEKSWFKNSYLPFAGRSEVLSIAVISCLCRVRTWWADVQMHCSWLRCISSWTACQHLWLSPVLRCCSWREIKAAARLREKTVPQIERTVAKSFIQNTFTHGLLFRKYVRSSVQAEHMRGAEHHRRGEIDARYFSLYLTFRADRWRPLKCTRSCLPPAAPALQRCEEKQDHGSCCLQY